MTDNIQISLDLRDQFGPVRDQGRRPTCLAFAASDSHAGARDGWAPLSCEFAFYRAQQRGMRPPTVGATLSHMLDALRFDGQPGEGGWPYLAATPTDVAAWKPPSRIGPLFGRNGSVSPVSFAAARAQIDAHRPVMMLMSLSSSFFTPDPLGVVMPAPGEMPQPTVRHAVIGVANGLVDGDQAILVRNSWGAGWGLDGHAWLTGKFIGSRLFGLAVLGEEVDVPPYSAAA